MLSDNKHIPKVSVVIPVYNGIPYLIDTLESVINQTYKNLEIIIIDDGSNDGSEIICKEYAQKDNRIKLIRRENGGLSAARNTGLDNMTGEYVAFLDSDDIYHPVMVEKMLQAVLFNDADCVICNHVIFNKDQKANYKKATINNNGKMYSRIEALKAVVNGKIECYAWDKLYKRELFNNLRYPVGQNYEDRYMILEILNKAKQVYILNDELVYYRKHPNSITSTYSLKNFQDLYKAYDKCEIFIKMHIPEIFTKNDLKKIQQIRLKVLISHYAHVLHINIMNKKETLEWLIENIKEKNANNEIKEYDIETRLIYHLLFNAPIIFSLCANFYPVIRKFVMKYLQKINS